MDVIIILVIALGLAIIFLNKYPIVVAVLILVCIGIAIWKLLQQRSINELNDKKILFPLQKDV